MTLHPILSQLCDMWSLWAGIPASSTQTGFLFIWSCCHCNCYTIIWTHDHGLCCQQVAFCLVVAYSALYAYLAVRPQRLACLWCSLNDIVGLSQGSLLRWSFIVNIPVCLIQVTICNRLRFPVCFYAISVSHINIAENSIGIFQCTVS